MFSATATHLYTTMSTESSTSGDSTTATKTSVITSLSRGDISIRSLPIVSNYLKWVQSVKIVICAWGKLGFITGELSAPAQTDPSYNSWLTENSVVSHGWWTQWNLPSATVTCGSQWRKRSGMLLERCILILRMPLSYKKIFCLSWCHLLWGYSLFFPNLASRGDLGKRSLLGYTTSSHY